MDPGTALSAAWSAGISVYAVLAALGIAGRFDVVDSPSVLQHTWVIALALALFVLEFVVDKIAYLDSVWDAIHTVVRPLIGGWLVATLPDIEVPTAVAGAVGVGLALSSHLAKSSTRAVVNTSPEPVSNVVVSFAEDGLVAGVMAIAVVAPELAAVVAIVLGIASLVVAYVLSRVARSVVRRVGNRRRPVERS